MVVPPPVEIEDLVVDVCLLSHTHYDHMDIPSIKRIGNRALWIVPLGVKSLLKKIGINNCVELNWWQTHTLKHSPSLESTTLISKNVEIVFTPAKHWSGRTLFDRNTALWGSFAVLTPSCKFFFAGDTSYCSIFKTIGKHFGPFDLAAIPIGAYKPRWFLKEVHCDPSEAIDIHNDLMAKQSIGIHWGTFPLADEDLQEPPLELARVRNLKNISVNDFFTMKHGETLLVGDSSSHDFATVNPTLYNSYLEYFSQTVNDVNQENGGVLFSSE